MVKNSSRNNQITIVPDTGRRIIDNHVTEIGLHQIDNKITTQVSHFAMNDDTTFNGRNIFTKSQQECCEDKQLYHSIILAQTLEDLNMVLIKKIYATHEPSISDTIITKWKNSDTTKEIIKIDIDLKVINEAQTIVSTTSNNKDSRPDTKDTLKKVINNINDNNIIEETKEYQKPDINFNEPPNIIKETGLYPDRKSVV